MDKEKYISIIEREHEGYYDIEKAMKLTPIEIKNHIWSRVSNGQPVPGCLSLACLRDALRRMGHKPIGFHDT